MLYFKNSELAAQHRISLKTVRNWIDAAKQGKLNLTLHIEGEKTYVANTPRNIAVISELVESRRKYRNSNATKTVAPSDEFYSIYTERQIYDIATNLEIHHEIPRQYNYFNGGAEYWDKYAARLAEDTTPNLVNSTIKLLDINLGYIDHLLAKYKRVNVIDIGVGNAYPVKGLLEHLLDKAKLGRYIALDVSPNVLNIAESNIRKWFGDKVQFEGSVYDINRDHFSDLLIDEYSSENAKDTINLVLLLGGTLSNMRDSDSGYKMIRDSMGRNDLLIHTTKLDTQWTRRYFDFDLQPGESRLAAIHGLVVDLLNIDKSFYSVEMGYDPDLRQRFEQIRLKISLNIKLKFNNGEHLIELEKDDAILTWRGLQQTATDVMDQLNRSRLYPLHISQTDDQEYILTVSKVRHD